MKLTTYLYSPYHQISYTYDDALTHDYFDLNAPKIIFQNRLILEGTIIFCDDYYNISTPATYDYCDELETLICYYINALTELLDKDVSEFYYPNFPLEVKLTKKHNNLLQMYINKQSLFFKLDDFISAFVKNGYILCSYLNENTRTHCMDLLNGELKMLENSWINQSHQ